MEGGSSNGGMNMIPGGNSYGGIDLQCSMGVQAQTPQFLNPHIHHHQLGSSSIHPSFNGGFPITMAPMQNSDQTLLMGERGKVSRSDDEEPSFTEEGVDAGKGKKGMAWQRVKWTDKMVKLLITAVSYVGEDMGSDYGVGGKRKFSALHKNGKWKSVCQVISERGCHVSPQQCEDKFNDLNKRYKKLNDMLGRGISCQVVEDPSLLDMIDYLSEKEKDDVRKIISSKQLFYEEMCSYHNGNRLHLPHDLDLQRSMQLALRSRDDHDDVRRVCLDDQDGYDDQDIEIDNRDESEDNHVPHADARGMYGGVAGGCGKKLKQGPFQDNIELGNSLNSLHWNRVPSSNLNTQTDVNQMFPDSSRSVLLQKQRIDYRKRQLEEQRMQIQAATLELEKQRFKWARFSKKKDCELEKLRMENEKMKIENEHMALELKHREMNAAN